MIKIIKQKIENKIGQLLRAHYTAFTVKRPYIINIGNTKELKGKIAIVTGGSVAIGRAISVRLAAEGCKVYVCGSHKGSARHVVDECTSLGLKAVGVTLNVLDADEIERVIDNIASDNGHIDILVNSAGGSARENANDIVYQRVDVIDDILNVNLRGAILCARSVGKYMV